MNPPSDPRPMKGTGRVNFIANLAAITADLNAGCTLKAVHQRHRRRLGISYPQFARYVTRYTRRYVPGQLSLPLPLRKAPPTRVEPLEPDNPTEVTPSGEAGHGAQQMPRTFDHDPVAQPDDDGRQCGDD